MCVILKHVKYAGELSSTLYYLSICLSANVALPGLLLKTEFMLSQALSCSDFNKRLS